MDADESIRRLHVLACLLMTPHFLHRHAYELIRGRKLECHVAASAPSPTLRPPPTLHPRRYDRRCEGVVCCHIGRSELGSGRQRVRRCECDLLQFMLIEHNDLQPQGCWVLCRGVVFRSCDAQRYLTSFSTYETYQVLRRYYNESLSLKMSFSLIVMHAIRGIC